MPDPRFSWPIGPIHGRHAADDTDHRGTWLGFDRASGKDFTVRGRSHLEYEPRFVEPIHTIEERAATLEKHHGIVTCSCRRVERCEPEGEAKLIYDPECKVHARKVRV
jgi:hypothetical protein